MPIKWVWECLFCHIFVSSGHIGFPMLSWFLGGKIQWGSMSTSQFISFLALALVWAWFWGLLDHPFIVFTKLLQHVSALDQIWRGFIKTRLSLNSEAFGNSLWRKKTSNKANQVYGVLCPSFICLAITWAEPACAARRTSPEVSALPFI